MSEAVPSTFDYLLDIDEPVPLRNSHPRIAKTLRILGYAATLGLAAGLAGCAEPSSDEVNESSYKESTQESQADKENISPKASLKINGLDKHHTEEIWGKEIPFYEVIMGDTLTFNATESIDPDSDTLNYMWGVGTEKIKEKSGAWKLQKESESPIFEKKITEQTKRLLIGLTVFDEQGESDTEYSYIDVYGKPPAPIVNVVKDPYYKTDVDYGTKLTLTAEESDNGVIVDSYWMVSKPIEWNPDDIYGWKTGPHSYEVNGFNRVIPGEDPVRVEGNVLEITADRVGKYTISRIVTDDEGNLKNEKATFFSVPTILEKENEMSGGGIVEAILLAGDDNVHVSFPIAAGPSCVDASMPPNTKQFQVQLVGRSLETGESFFTDESLAFLSDVKYYYNEPYHNKSPEDPLPNVEEIDFMYNTYTEGMETGVIGTGESDWTLRKIVTTIKMDYNGIEFPKLIGGTVFKDEPDYSITLNYEAFRIPDEPYECLP